MLFYSRCRNVFFVSVLFFIFTFTISISIGDQQKSRHPRSIKDALPKDDEFSQARAVSQMRHKVFDLENAMKLANNEIEDLTNKTTKMEVTLSEQSSMLKNLDTKFDALTKILTDHASTLTDLESLTSPDENIFALSNQTCGEVLVGQTGSIVFSSYPYRTVRYPWNCIWTIRANNRAFIKVSSNIMPRSSYSYSSRSNAFVVEFLKNNGTSNSTTNSTIPFEIKLTKLQKNMHHIFSGPLIFIVFSPNAQADDYSDVDLHLQYEGMGKLTEKATFFSHVSLKEDVGDFNSSQIEAWMPGSDLIPENANFTLDYTTIVISNFSTKVHLQALFQNGCSSGDSFLIITDLLEESRAITDCCRTSCAGRNSRINYDNPFVILISKKFQRTLNFNLTWVAEPAYPSTSGSVVGNPYGSKCGEILGGVSGTILYKPHVSYRNGERCIWVIMPQPRPRASITVNVGANGVENTYDHLYMMELTNASGDPLPDAPKITRIGRYGTYEANSRELYIVFYSDSSVTGYGFSLSWKSTGDIVPASRDVTTRFTILKDDDGAAQSLEMKPPLTNDAYQVFLLTPVMPYSYVFGMQLHVNQTSPIPTGNNCLHSDITVLTASDGILNKTRVECSDPGQAQIENADGMGMIIVENRESNSGNVAMNFSWREIYGEGNTTYTVVDSNNCGGIIKGDKGMIKYKIGTDYQNNERCVWLLHSPNSTTITLKLQKDGFESCCDQILVTTVDPTNGILRNDTLNLNRVNRTRTFQESLLVVVFRSDGSTRGRGFSLQFTGDEVAPSSQYRYQLRHHNEPYGNVVYPSSDWEDPVDDIQDIFVIASSLSIGENEDPLIMPTNISWSSGVFRKDNRTCNYDSIAFYTTPEPEGWLERERYPKEEDTEDCPEQVEVAKKDDIFSTVYSAFLAIYKPLERQQNEARMRMGFAFEKSAGCGGVIIGDSGEISYKETGRYSNLEKCVWLVHAPQARRIRFYLARSGFEECCDVLMISPLNLETGVPAPASIISQYTNRTSIIDGPIAIVVLSTDSSVVGDGFRLQFFTDSTITQDFPYTFHIEQQNRPTENNFIFNVQEANEIVVVAYSPEIFRGPATSTPVTQIEVASFRPQVDEQCNSDTLTIYDIFGRDKGIVSAKSYAASPTPTRLTTTTTSTTTTTTTESTPTNATTESSSVSVIAIGRPVEEVCLPFEDSAYKPCDNILDCGDSPRFNTVITNTTSFIAVYKSANVTSGNLRFRGFVLTSTATTRSSTY